MIYLCFLIPLIAIIIMSWKFPRRVNITERIIIFAVPAIAIIVAKVISTSTQTHDTEYWNSHVIKSTYYERWNEWIEKRCCASYDASGNCTNWYDCSYCEEHPAYWTASDNIGKTYSYTKAQFERDAKMWNSRKFKDMNRDYHTVDGDVYVATYDKVFEHTVPIVKQYGYKNKIQASKSVFNFEPVDTAQIRKYGLYRYPYYELMGIFNYNPVMGTVDKDVVNRLRWHNAHMGAVWKVNMMLLVFHNQPVRAAVLQERYWKRGNKNEFILCLGHSGGKIKWAKVISWTDKKMIMKTVEQKARRMDYKNLAAIVDMMANEVKVGQFTYKKFEEDFNYIRVEPTMKAVIWTMVITFVITVIICLIAVFNQFECDIGNKFSRFSR